MVSDISIPIFNMFNYTWVDDPQWLSFIWFFLDVLKYVETLR
jgi:hypothetical protein